VSLFTSWAWKRHLWKALSFVVKTQEQEHGVHHENADRSARVVSEIAEPTVKLGRNLRVDVSCVGEWVHDYAGT
jgi:hypothetical protein